MAIGKDVIFNESILGIKRIMQPKQTETYMEIQLKLDDSEVPEEGFDPYSEVDVDGLHQDQLQLPNQSQYQHWGD